MINIKKYFYSAFVVYAIALVLLLFAWFVSLQLTQQRVQLEAENKLVNLTSNKSFFVWDFNSFNDDVVESFQYFWQVDSRANKITALKGTNPQLSLNFSGDVLDSLLHKTIVIDSVSSKDVSVKIQFKSDLNGSVFYYSPVINLTNSLEEIDLDILWQGINNENKVVTKDIWGADKHKVSSLVLHFTNPVSDFTINKVSMPYTNQGIKSKEYEINCAGQFQEGINPTTQNIFTLNENCWFPSNYMWLKHHVQQEYPESLLSLGTGKLWQETSQHKINKPYTNIATLNIILYALVFVVFLIAYLIRKKHIHIEKVIEETWYKWVGRQLLFKGANKVITPYHLLINYSFVLIPSLLLFVIMVIYKSPSLSTFKLLPMYFLWALLQQFILGYVLAQRVFYNRIQNRLIASVLAGLVFSVFHLPSVTLMVVTFFAGCFWAYAWLVFRRLLPLAISHSVLALMFYSLVSERFLYSAKVFQWFWE